jgi:hypothetical protein
VVAASLTASNAGQLYDFSETFILFGSTFLVSVSVDVSGEKEKKNIVFPY